MNVQNWDPSEKIFQRIREIQSIPVKFSSHIQSEFQHFNGSSVKNGDFHSMLIENVKVNDEQKSIPEAKVPEYGQSSHKYNGNSFQKIIEEAAKRNDLDPKLIKAVIQAESDYKPNAKSEKGALGLMQLMPATAKMMGVVNPLDPEENINGGSSYLAGLMKEFQNRNEALAAYNAGPGAVRKYGGVPPYKETKDYINKINRYLKE